MQSQSRGGLKAKDNLGLASASGLPKRGSKVKDTDKILAAEMAMMKKKQGENKKALSKRALAAAAASPRQKPGMGFWKDKSPNLGASESTRGSIRDRQEAVGKVGRVNETLACVSKNAALAEVRKEKDLKRVENKAKAQREQVEKVKMAKERASSVKRKKEEDRILAKGEGVRSEMRCEVESLLLTRHSIVSLVRRRIEVEAD